jgi:HEAT repeat protein
MTRKTSSLAFVFAAGLVACGQAPDPMPTSSPSVARQEARSASSPTECNEAGLDLLLRAPHEPPTAEELLRQCTDPVPRLTHWATSIEARGLMRLRALESLGRVGGEPAIQVLAERARAKDDLPSMRRASLVALGRATSVGDSARDDTAIECLTDSDPHVRVAAADLLRKSPNQRSLEALERAATRETTSFVKLAIEKAVAK